MNFNIEEKDKNKRLDIFLLENVCKSIGLCCKITM